MGEKIYMRDNSIQYLGYYLIEHELYDYVFYRFPVAMSFCWSRGLDPNKVIQTNSPEVFHKCKEIAHRRLEELNHTKQSIKWLWDKALADSDRLGKRIEEYEEKLKRERDLMAKIEFDMAREEIIKQSGVIHGIYECMKAIDAERDNYFGIVYQVSRWDKR